MIGNEISFQQSHAVTHKSVGVWKQRHVITMGGEDSCLNNSIILQ